MMEKEIKRIVRRAFPELASGYHLPHFARIEAVREIAADAAPSERFRAGLAADVVVLDQHGLPDPEFPIFKSVPLPVPGAGFERGFYSYPEPGAIVEVAFAYGLPDQVFIRQVLPWHTSIPSVHAGEMVVQAAPGVEQRTRNNGDMERVTHGAIREEALTHITSALDVITRAHHHQVSATSSNEEVSGVKRIEALGALRLLSGGTLNAGAVENLNITSGSDINELSARDRKSNVAQDALHQVGRHQVTTTGENLTETCGGIAQRIAALKQLIQVEAGGTVWVGNNATNVLQILSDLIQVVTDIATTTATHNHPSVGVCSQGAAFTALSAQSTALKTVLDPIVE